MRGALAAGADAPAELRAPVLAGAGMLSFLQCDYEVARGKLTARAWRCTRSSATTRARPTA